MDEILIALFHDVSSRRDLLATLKAHPFGTDSEKWLIKNVIEPAGDGELSESIVESAVYSRVKDQDRATTIFQRAVKAFAQIEERKENGQPISNASLALHTVREFIRRQALRKALVLGVEGLNDSESNTTEVYQKLIDDLSGSGGVFRDDPEFDIYVVDQELKDRLKRRNVSITQGKRFMFPDPMLQKSFPNGVSAGEMFGIVADTGVGKSLSVDNWAIDAFRQGLNVLLIKTENEEIQTSARLDAIASGVDYQRIFKSCVEDAEIEDIEKEYQSIHAKYGNHLFLVQVIPFGFDANTIRRIIQKIKDEHKVTIDCLMIDSPEHQQPIEHQREYFMRKSVPYWDNKTLMKEEGLIVFTTIQRKVDQGNLFKAAKKKKEDDDDKFSIPTPEQAAGSVEIPRILDYMVMALRPTPRDKALGGIKLFSVKSRGSELISDVMFIRRDSSTLRQEVIEYDTVQASASYDMPEDGMGRINDDMFDTDFDDIDFGVNAL